MYNGCTRSLRSIERDTSQACRGANAPDFFGRTQMGECTLTPHFGDFGDRKAILDIGPNYPRFDTKDEADPGSIINGGPGVPVMTPEGKR